MDGQEGVKKYKWLLISIGGFVLVALMTAWAFGISGNESATSLAGIADGEAGTVPSDDAALVTDSDGRVVPASDTNGDTSGSSGSGGSDSDAPGIVPPAGDGDGSSATDPPPAPPGAVMTVRIMFWNDTNSNSAKGCEVIIDGNAWVPDTDSASDAGAIDGLAYDNTLDLVVLPNGSGGDRFEVPVKFTSVMDPGSERDAIHVEVSDGEVRVIGNAVENFDVRFERS